MTSHIFDCGEAKKYGVDEAIILANMKYWLDKNKANNANLNDNQYWTYNSVKAFGELFNYWSSRQIQRILKSLSDQGVLIEGNYNKSSYDRTKWYTLNASHYPEYSITPNGQMEDTTQSNGFTQNVEPIPDSKLQIVNSNSKPDINTNDITAKTIIDHLNKKTGFNYRHVDSHLKHINARLEEGYILQDIIHVIDAKVEEWQGTKFEQYLRPATLFNKEKFNQYAGQTAKEKIDDFSWADGGRVSDHTKFQNTYDEEAF